MHMQDANRTYQHHNSWHGTDRTSLLLLHELTADQHHQQQHAAPHRHVPHAYCITGIVPQIRMHNSNQAASLPCASVSFTRKTSVVQTPLIYAFKTVSACCDIASMCLLMRLLQESALDQDKQPPASQSRSSNLQNMLGLWHLSAALTAQDRPTSREKGTDLLSTERWLN